jgi:uncharacterized membrane protein YgdD (TMEM256/DUF423 family)
MITRLMILSGSAFAGLAVVLGAFGAHGLRSKISPEQLQSFETGVKYQFIHALAILLLGILSDRIPAGGARWSYYLFTSGIVLFSGSIYLLSTRDVLGISSWKSFLGPITPLGGLCMIAGWITLFMAAFRSTSL